MSGPRKNLRQAIFVVPEIFRMIKCSVMWRNYENSNEFTFTAREVSARVARQKPWLARGSPTFLAPLSRAWGSGFRWGYPLKDKSQTEASNLLKYLWLALALLCLWPGLTSPVALLLGAGFGLVFGNPYSQASQKLIPRLLQISVVGLGAGMDLRVVGQVGAHGIAYTVSGILLTLLMGQVLGRALGNSRDLSLLISVGTAICGGSAIAALAPVIRAKYQDVTIALATVFILNSIALLIFPAVGHGMGMGERSFGLWCALAIHDTSSVVGATLQYGREALQVGTTVKLARALWIVPLTLGFAWLTHRRANARAEGSPPVKVKLPWFILGFIGVAALVTYIPSIKPVAGVVEVVARRGLVVTLFLIGSSISRESLKAVGTRPLIQGCVLWLLVASGSLLGVWAGWIGV